MEQNEHGKVTGIWKEAGYYQNNLNFIQVIASIYHPLHNYD